MAKLTSRAAAAVAIATLQVLFAVGVTGLRRSEFVNFTSKASTIDYRSIFPAVVIFGDSTVDAGNNNHLLTVVKSNFEPYGRHFPGGPTGRFTDGKIVTDFVSERVGFPLTLPYLAPNAHGEAILIGINLASSASGWYEGTAANFNVKGLDTQFLWYKNWKNEVLSLVGPEEGNNIISNALYIFSTGANDWVNNYYLNPILMKKYTPDAYITLLIGLAKSYIQELYQLGGRSIVVLDLPPIGCLPSQITLHGKGKQGCVEEFNNDALKFNRQLQALINDLKPTLHGGRLVYIETFTLLHKLVTNPKEYGFTETRAGCCGTGTLETAILCNKASIGTCKDSYPFVWWDSFHPTEHAYGLLAADIFNQAEPTLLAPPQP